MMLAEDLRRDCLSAFVVLLCGVGVVGCATTQRQMYVDWVKTPNPQSLCEGRDDCVQYAVHNGKPLCRIITADRDVSYARLGRQVRECLKGDPLDG